MSRKAATAITAITHLLSLIALILAILGTTSPHTLPRLFFFKLDVSHIIPISVPNSPLLNSVARSLGLHDFYQTGLWNFCEGYLDTGITACSPPRAFFWFDPVSVLVAELLAGARIALPARVVTLLRILQAGQQVTYAFFLAGAVLEFLAMLCVPLVLAGRRRWVSAVLATVAALAALLVCVAAAIASAISIAAKVALTAQDQLNIRVHVGIPMFVCVWIAAVLAVVAFVLQAALGCCCLPKRSADGASAGPVVSEKPSRFGLAALTRRRNRVS